MQVDAECVPCGLRYDTLRQLKRHAWLWHRIDGHTFSQLVAAAKDGRALWVVGERGTRAAAATRTDDQVADPVP
jgi:hypothetical protein